MLGGTEQLAIFITFCLDFDALGLGWSYVNPTQAILGSV